MHSEWAAVQPGPAVAITTTGARHLLTVQSVRGEPYQSADKRSKQHREGSERSSNEGRLRAKVT